MGLFEAWSLWWQGKSLQGLKLWGLPVLWVGRVGKVMSFVGSVVAVIHIIGPKRIREWARRTRRHKGTMFWIPTVLGLAVFESFVYATYYFGRGQQSGSLGARAGEVALVFVPLAAVMYVALGAVDKLVERMATVMESGRWEPVVRWSAFGLVIVGFSFDLLAS